MLINIHFKLNKNSFYNENSVILTQWINIISIILFLFQSKKKTTDFDQRHGSIEPREHVFFQNPLRSLETLVIDT